MIDHEEEEEKNENVFPAHFSGVCEHLFFLFFYFEGEKYTVISLVRATVDNHSLRMDGSTLNVNVTISFLSLELRTIETTQYEALIDHRK